MTAVIETSSQLSSSQPASPANKSTVEPLLGILSAQFSERLPVTCLQLSLEKALVCLARTELCKSTVHAEHSLHSEPFFLNSGEDHLNKFPFWTVSELTTSIRWDGICATPCSSGKFNRSPLLTLEFCLLTDKQANQAAVVKNRTSPVVATKQTQQWQRASAH